MEDDVILPDDFEATPQADEVTEPEVTEEVTTEPVEDTKPTEEVSTEPQRIKVKYNKEEKEIPIDEAIPLVQKGMNYDKLQERLQTLESDPRLSFVESLAKEQGMDVNQFIEAYRQHQEQERLNELIQNNIPEDLAQEILENRKFRQQYEAQQREAQQKQQQDEEYTDFLQAYPDVKPDQIPPEVWEIHAQGTPLKFAYMQHEYSQLQNQVKILKQNQENQKKAPVQGITSHGSDEVASTDPFLIGFDSI